MGTADSGKRGPVILSGQDASGRDGEGSSLVPMLIVGLVLVTIGALAIMAFV